MDWSIYVLKSGLVNLRPLKGIVDLRPLKWIGQFMSSKGDLSILYCFKPSLTVNPHSFVAEYFSIVKQPQPSFNKIFDPKLRFL